MVVVPRFYEVRKKKLARVSRSKEVRTNPVFMLVHFAPQAAIQVQPLNVSNNGEGMKSPSGLLDRDESQLWEGGEETPKTSGLGSLSLGGKVVPTRRKMIARMASNLFI
nr:hypothetical protein CFP56_38604 [Quercus suber]